MKLQHECVIYVADVKLNKFMGAMIYEPKKVYVDQRRVSFSTDTLVDASYLFKWIREFKRQRTENNFWIPAIIWQGEMFVDSDVRYLSDGEKFVTIPQDAQFVDG